MSSMVCGLRKYSNKLKIELRIELVDRTIPIHSSIKNLLMP